MKQVLQNLRTGATEITEVPCPACGRGHLLVRANVSLISAGTERMLVNFGQASWFGKARAQPEKVRQVIDKIRTDGLMATLDSVLRKLDHPLPLGYSSVGTVIEVGEGVTGFSIGDRVVSNGSHADIVSVPRNLCCRIPDRVSDEEAAFTVIGAIALQGIRLVAPTLGEVVVVIGLGLIGLMAVQLLQAQGCRVLGIDYDAARVRLASGYGVETINLSAGEDSITGAQAFSRGRGVDAVIITASTKSSEPVHQAATMCRKRGRIVLVGATGLELTRADFYEKELSFQVSCSYGPGRYDPSYEELGVDYPVGFVRWTEQRNFEAVVDMLADRRLDVRPLISHRFPIADADAAYHLVTSDAPSLGILLSYARLDAAEPRVRDRTIPLEPEHDGRSAAPQGAATGVTLGFVGSGNYATGVLIPAFKTAGGRLRVVASNHGVSGAHAGRKFGIESTTTDVNVVFADPAVDAVVITTRHDSHAQLVQSALLAGKHVFVEKPLALSSEELDAIQAIHAVRPDRLLMVGFNRRFAPLIRQMRTLLGTVLEPKCFVITVNAGSVPATHWTQDRSAGGGRIVGEACHFIDLLRFLANSPIEGLHATAMRPAAGLAIVDDKASITLNFADGSMGTILYLANGHRSFPKERIEVFAAGRVLQLDNFRRLSGFGWPGFRRASALRQNKGQRECAAAFVNAVARNGPAPIPIEELLEVSRAAVGAAAAVR